MPRDLLKGDVLCRPSIADGSLCLSRSLCVSVISQQYALSESWLLCAKYLPIVMFFPPHVDGSLLWFKFRVREQVNGHIISANKVAEAGKHASRKRPSLTKRELDEKT